MIMCADGDCPDWEIPHPPHPGGVPFGWEVERYVDDLGLPLCEWQRDVILRQWPDPRPVDPAHTEGDAP